MKNRVIDKPSQYYELVLDKKIRVSQVIPVSPEIVRVIYEDHKPFVSENSASNAVVALWTTSEARIRLYGFMKQAANVAGTQVLYTDTDSIILKHPRGQCPIKIGSFLGEMAQEYPDYEILEYVGAGPKQYALKMKNKKDKSEKILLKIRGITFDKHNENVLGYEKFKSTVLEYARNESNSVLFNYNCLRPDKFSNIHTIKTSKFYRPVNTKGFVKDLTIYPFGYSLF